MRRESAPLDSAIVARVRASFARQGAMATLGAELADIASGRVAITLPIEPPLPAGRLPPRRGRRRRAGQRLRLRGADPDAGETEVLTVELKVNLLAPASGKRLVVEGEVVRAGRTLTVCRGDAHAEQEAERVHVATMLATMLRRRVE